MLLDKYRGNVFQFRNSSNQIKYKLISKFVKTLLSLPHSNADRVRGFSLNKIMLQGRSKLNLQSINAIRQIK